MFLPRCFGSIDTSVNPTDALSACDIGPAAHTAATACSVQSRSRALNRVGEGARPHVSNAAGGSHAGAITYHMSTMCVEDASGLQLIEPNTADEAAFHSSTTSSSAQLTNKLQPHHTAGTPARCSSFSCSRGSMQKAHHAPGRTSTEWELHRPGSSWREAGPEVQDPAGTSSAFSRRVSGADAAAAQRSSTSTPQRRSLDFQQHNCSTSSGDVAFSGAGGGAAGADHLFCVSISSSSLPQTNTSLQLQHSGPLGPWLEPTEGPILDIARMSTGSTGGSSSSTLPIVMTQGTLGPDVGSEGYTCQQQWSPVSSSAAKLGPLLLDLLANPTHVQHPSGAAGCATPAPDTGANLCSTSCSLVRTTSTDLAMQLQLSAACCDCLPAGTPSGAAVAMAPCMTASEPLPYLTRPRLTSAALFPSRALGTVNQPSASGRRSFDLGSDDIATLAAAVAAEKMAQIEQLKALEAELREQVISLLPLI